MVARKRKRKVIRTPKEAERGALEGGSWACLEGMGVIVVGGRSVLVIRELHVFSQADARALAKELKTKVLPHKSHIVKNRPTFDGRPKEARR